MQTYFAQSIFVSRTFWVNVAIFIVAILRETEISSLIPAVLQEHLLAVAAVINIALRVFTVRPVAFVSPGDTTPVQVPSLPQK